MPGARGVGIVIPDAVDLFAGPGGWDLGLADLGLSALGIEIDSLTCATRRAAGLQTLHADVREAGRPRAVGLIASPPCPAFSAAGKLAGRAVLADLAEEAATAVRPRLDGWPEDAGLGLTPLAWALRAMRTCAFRWLAWEQVPPVLPLWEACAERLAREGYGVATGILDAADFGVPQRRKRAFLVASLGFPVALPEPTHAAPVSMGEALGWPPGYVGFPRRADAGRASIDIEGMRYRARDLKSTEHPSFTLTEKARSWSRFDRDGTRHRVTLPEASVLQGFPPTYPWQGPRYWQFHQLGNAVPPPLAVAVLRAAMGVVSLPQERQSA